MIITFLIWCFVFIVSFGYGHTLLKGINLDFGVDKTKISPSYFVPVFIVGFIVCNIMATVLSLFIPIGFSALSLITVPAIILFMRFWGTKNLKSIVDKNNFRFSDIPFWVTGFFLFLFILWLTTGPIQNSDTYIYHAQSIHWIESYPMIKGLGNFFNRLAYNSNWFIQNALFSFSFLGNQSFHGLNGLLTFMISLYFLSEFKLAFYNNDLRIPQIIGILLIPLGLISIGSQSSAPSTDMPVVYLAWFAGYFGMNADSKIQKNLVLFLLTGVTTFSVVIKISILPIVVLPILFTLIHIRSIQKKQLVIALVWMISIALPWMIRNVFISGYAVYPISATALPVEWRIPSDLVTDDEFGIRAFGFYERAPANEVMAQPYFNRIKFWFNNLTLNQKSMVLVSFFTPIFFIAIGLLTRVRKIKFFNYHLLISTTSFYIGILFWLFVSPNLRFGYVYLLFLFSVCCAIIAYLLLRISGVLKKGLGYSAVFAVLVILVFLFTRSFKPEDLSQRWLHPLDYGHRSTFPCKIDNGKATILCASEYGECGYYPFPCHAWGNENVKMYGDEFIDGFYFKKR